MTSVFGHCRDSFSFWTIQFNLEVFVNLGVGPIDMAARAQHLLLIGNYWYTIHGHSIEHTRKLDSWNRE